MLLRYKLECLYSIVQRKRRCSVPNFFWLFGIALFSFTTYSGQPGQGLPSPPEGASWHTARRSRRKQQPWPGRSNLISRHSTQFQGASLLFVAKSAKPNFFWKKKKESAGLPLSCPALSSLLYWVCLLQAHAVHTNCGMTKFTRVCKVHNVRCFFVFILKQKIYTYLLSTYRDS